MFTRLALLAVLLLAAASYAATWAVWVPVQNNSPSSGASSTFGNYWSYGAAFYSTASVNWIMPPMPERGPASFYNITSYLGTSGAASVYATSSQATLSSYMYSGAVSAAYTAPLGSSTSISATNGIFALAAVSISSEYCGSLYFMEFFTLSAVSTAYIAAELANSTWAYLTFYSAGNVGSGSVGLGQGLPSTCYSPGTYLLAVSIYVTGGQINGVTDVQVSNSNTGTGASYVPGTQYALSISPASGDAVVFPWTTSASPYVVTAYAGAVSVVNTAGSPSSGYFSLSGASPIYLSSGNMIFYRDSSSQLSIAAANCPQNVYFLPATASVSKLLTCSGMPAPSGAAVYPTDYSKYASTATTFTPFSIPSGLPATASFQISYTDSAGNAYTTTPGVFQPTNPSISSTNSQGYLAQLPQCTITSNPYGGPTGTYSLLNCVAIKYGAVSIVVWFYDPPGGMGDLFGFQENFFPENAVTNTPLAYIGTNGRLYVGDWNGEYLQVSTSINPGWHMIVMEEYYSGGAYHVNLFLDGQYIGQSSGTATPYLFGAGGPYPYGYIGGLFNYIWDNTLNYQYFFFNGTIAYFALYNTVLNLTQIQQLYQAGFPNTLFANNLVVSYMLSLAYYSGNGYYFVPYYVNAQLMGQMGIGNYNAVSITPSGSTGAIPSSQFMVSQLTAYLSGFSISAAVPYTAFVRNPSIAVGGTYYVPVPRFGWTYVGSGYLPSPSVSGSTNVTAVLVGQPGVSYYPALTVNGSALRLPFSPIASSYTVVFYGLGGTAETLGVTPNGPPGTWFLSSNSTAYTVPSAPHSSTLVVPTTTGVFFARSLGDWWNATGATFYVASLVNSASGTGPYTIQMNGQKFAA
ncbi:MAG: hypothetical protein RXR01_10580, partial [Thermoproteus sp.]